jgi:hypothetical protein
MRKFGVVAALLASAGMLAAGCGASSIPAQTTTLPAGTRVGPQEFLGDSAATATAIRHFADALGANGPTLTNAQAKASASTLQQYLAQAQVGLQRLSAEQVDDARLDAQRSAVVGPLAIAVDQMTAITTAAAAGHAAAVVAHLAPLRVAIANLKLAGA